MQGAQRTVELAAIPITWFDNFRSSCHAQPKQPWKLVPAVCENDCSPACSPVRLELVDATADAITRAPGNTIAAATAAATTDRRDVRSIYTTSTRYGVED